MNLRLITLVVLAVASHAQAAACVPLDVKGAWALTMEGAVQGKVKGVKAWLPSRLLGRFQFDGKRQFSADVRSITLVGGSKFAMDFVRVQYNGTYEVADATKCQYVLTAVDPATTRDALIFAGVLNAARMRMDAVWGGAQMSGKFERMPSVPCTLKLMVGPRTFSSSFAYAGPKRAVAVTSYAGAQSYSIVNNVGLSSAWEYAAPALGILTFNGTFVVYPDCSVVESFGYYHLMLADYSSYYISTDLVNGWDFGYLAIS